MKCRGKQDTTWNIPRSITFSPLHFMLDRRKSISFGTLYYTFMDMAWSEGMLSRSHSFWKVSILRISWDTATNIHTAKHSTFCSSSIPTLHILMCKPLSSSEPILFYRLYIYILKISSRRDGRISDAALPPPSLFTTKNSLYLVKVGYICSSVFEKPVDLPPILFF